MSTNELIIIIGVAVIAALLKSITGLGYPLLLVPVLALFLDIADAIVIVAPSNLVLNGQISWVNRSHKSGARTLKPFALVGIAGTIVGTILLPILPDRGLRIALIGIVVAFIISRRSKADDAVERDPTSTDRYAGGVGFVAGIFQGAAGVSAPVVSAWFLSRQIAVDAFVFAVTASFTLHGSVQLLVLLFQPQFSDELLLGLILVPFALVMVPVGAFLRKRLNAARFEQLVIAVLIVAAISLFVRVI